MKNRTYAYCLNFVVWISLLTAFSDVLSGQVKQKIYEGEAIRMIANRMDIYHARNDFVRERMQLDAVFDAIEKATAIQIQGSSVLYQESFAKESNEVNFENYVSQLLKKYNLQWQRKSNYDFVNLSPSKWKVTTTGVIADNNFNKKNLVESGIPYQGKAIKIIGNNKDIYHSDNDIVREHMKQVAVLDAVEKGASISLEGDKSHIFNSTTLNKSEDQSTNYISSVLETYQIAWQRKSSYIFEKISRKKWTVSVEGLVSKSTHTKDSSKTSDFFQANKKKFIVENKSLNKVDVNISSTDNVTSNHLVVYGTKKRKRISGGYNRSKYPKALLYITHRERSFVQARILRGFFRVTERDVVEPSYFKTWRSGVQYSFSLNYPLVQEVTSRSVDSDNSFSIFTHAISYYRESLVTRLGFRIGYQFASIQNRTNSKEVAVQMPNIGLTYALGIIPDVMHLVPEFGMGILDINENTKSIFPNDITLTAGSHFFLCPKLFLQFRIKLIDILFGGTYQYVFTAGSSPLSGFFPSASIKVNLVSK